MPRYGRIDRDYAMRLAGWEPATDGPVFMLNLMKYRERAAYSDPESAGEGPAVSGREADDRYAPVDVLRAIGAAVTFYADVAESTEDWDRVGVVRYPTRHSFIEMQARRDFQERHVHKEAGMDHTIVLGTLPAASLPRPGTPRVLLEVWRGAEPESVVPEAAATFTVEGTILGDGRTWDGARYTPVGADTVLPPGGPEHQLLLLEPTVERW